MLSSIYPSTTDEQTRSLLREAPHLIRRKVEAQFLRAILYEEADVSGSVPFNGIDVDVVNGAIISKEVGII